MLIISATFCLLWFAANYFYNLSLNMTDISSNTIICNTSIIFVFIFSWIFLKTEKYNWIKIAGIFTCFGGACIVIFSNPSNDSLKLSSKTIFGDLFALCSAVSYGLYSTFLKRRIPSDRETYFKASLFLGLVGLCNLIFLLPLFPILHYSGIETFEWPPGKTLGYLTLNALIGTCVSDYCWAWSVVILGPLIT